MTEKPNLYIEDPHFVKPRKFLPDDRYAEAMEALVIVCADVMFINRDRRTVLLVWRRAKPLPGWWFIGGRIYAGEEERHGAGRVMERETKLSVAPERLAFLNMHRYICAEREQNPQHVGSDTLAYMFAVELTDEERSVTARHLDQNEYDGSKGLREFSRRDLVEEKVHPAVVDAYDRLFGSPTT
ncbi:NUDIX domain-containing protein [Candidatus Kaiserbacteria bacterium]|nr:NUDIX domain-containing protein [Candidatus Kaiserbacteria bacterium]